MSNDRFECEQAIRDMTASKILLEQSTTRPCVEHTYFEALDHVVENSKRLGEAMTHIASASKNNNQTLFIQAVQDASRTVCQIVQGSAQVNKLNDISFYSCNHSFD
jgi:talin